MNRNGTAQASAVENVQEYVQSVRTRDDFVTLVRALQAQLRNKPDEWENQDLPTFLEALASWVEDMEGYYRNSGQPVPDPPTWKALGEMLLAARVYE